MTQRGMVLGENGRGRSHSRSSRSSSSDSEDDDDVIDLMAQTAKSTQPMPARNHTQAQAHKQEQQPQQQQQQQGVDHAGGVAQAGQDKQEGKGADDHINNNSNNINNNKNNSDTDSNDKSGRSGHRKDDDDRGNSKSEGDEDGVADVRNVEGPPPTSTDTVAATKKVEPTTTTAAATTTTTEADETTPPVEQQKGDATASGRSTPQSTQQEAYHPRQAPQGQLQPQPEAKQAAHHPRTQKTQQTAGKPKRPPNWANPFAPLPKSQPPPSAKATPALAPSSTTSTAGAAGDDAQQRVEPSAVEQAEQPASPGSAMEASFATLTMTENEGDALPFPEIDPENVVPNFAAAYDYAAREVDEVDLHKGDVLYVTEMGPDGWYVGLNITTGVQGTFPGNFVVRLEQEPEGDAEYARRLQEEEEKQALAPHSEGADHATPQPSPVPSSSTASHAVADDEMLARQLQEEEDRLFALAQQRHESEVPVGPAMDALMTSSPDYESFDVKFLGSLNVPPRPTTDMILVAIREVLAARKRLRYSATKMFELQVSLRGIRLIEQPPKRRGTILRRRAASGPPTRATTASLFPLHHVSHCAFDQADHKCFGFITRNDRGNKFACHVFQYSKSATTIVNAIGRAFKDAQHARARPSQRQAQQGQRRHWRPQQHHQHHQQQHRRRRMP